MANKGIGVATLILVLVILVLSLKILSYFVIFPAWLPFFRIG